MGKRKKEKEAIDFQFGVSGIIPATQNAFSEKKFSGQKRKEESGRLKFFKKSVISYLKGEVKNLKQFPTDNEIFVFILQYFISEKEYKSRDVDNMSKTILDLLQSIFYNNDGQVKTLLMGKKLKINKIPQNFAYVAVKELKSDNDINALKVSGIDRSIALFQELKAKK